MKFNKYFMLGLAGLAFAACSNDEDITNEREDGKVQITLSLGRTETTRSFSQSAAGLYNDVTDIKIVFYNAAGAFVAYPSSGEIGGVPYDNEAAINDAVKNGLISDTHKVTVTLKEVPSSASQVYIVANSKGKTNQIGTTSLNDARKTIIHLKNQIKDEENITRFSGEESRLTGLGQIAADGKANVQLRPAPSRIEMGKITAVPVPSDVTWGGVQIKSFTVTGFYINKFRVEGYLDGKTLGLPEITDGAQDYGQDKDSYTKAKYTEKTWGMMCDEPAVANYTYTEGDDNTTVYSATPVDGKWYGYMLLRGTPADVVVKLNVAYTDGTDADKFLTITKYTYNSTWDDYFGTTHQEGELVSEFLRGHVYRLSDIRFDVTNLTDVPYETTKTVTASVEVMPWVGIDVTPGFH